MRPTVSGYGMPSSACSSSFQPAPRPISTRPPLISSTVATIFANTPGRRNVTGDTIVTLLLALDDYVPLMFGSNAEHLFLKGPVYLVYSLVGDLFGVFGLIGDGMAVYRRYFMAPAKIDWDRRQKHPLAAYELPCHKAAASYCP